MYDIILKLYKNKLYVYENNQYEPVQLTHIT